MTMVKVDIVRAALGTLGLYMYLTIVAQWESGSATTG